MSSLKKTLQWLLVAVAGVASFYVSMQWRRASLSETTPLVEAVARESHPPVTPAIPALAIKQTTAMLIRDNTLELPDRAHVVPQSSGDAFAELSWIPHPPVVRTAPPPPPAPVVPTAPALPFVFVGLMEQGAGKPQAFLSKGDTLLVVAAGDVIDSNNYRVDSLSAQQIGITYLPLNTPQTLTISGTSK